MNQVTERDMEILNDVIERGYKAEYGNVIRDGGRWLRGWKFWDDCPTGYLQGIGETIAEAAANIRMVSGTGGRRLD